MGRNQEVRVPDIGDFEDVEVIEVLIAPGDVLAAEDSIVTLESEKATMEVPCPFAGVVKEVRVREGDRVSAGALLLVLETEASAGASAPPAPEAKAPPPVAEPAAAAAPAAPAAPPARPAAPAAPKAAAAAAAASRAGARRAAPAKRPAGTAGVGHAGPSVRRFARELGVDISLVRGSGRKHRILKQDVQEFVKRALGGGASLAIPDTVVQVEPAPVVDFAAFGEIEVKPLGNVRRLAAANLRRSWIGVPHVTQHDEADITALEELRKQQQATARERGVKLTLVAYLAKAVARVLHEFPQFAASLDATGENLILKKYMHIGVAVDTPVGLLVPVVRDVDRKDVFDVAAELADLAERGRKRRLRTPELQGGCFTISSLGGIGGTAFTPIVNSPEVAILGVSRHAWRPVWQDGAFVPRLILPLSLSYDHRVIDGADGARFARRLCDILSDVAGSGSGGPAR